MAKGPRDARCLADMPMELLSRILLDALPDNPAERQRGRLLGLSVVCKSFRQTCDDAEGDMLVVAGCEAAERVHKAMDEGHIAVDKVRRLEIKTLKTDGGKEETGQRIDTLLRFLDRAPMITHLAIQQNGARVEGPFTRGTLAAMICSLSLLGKTMPHLQSLTVDMHPCNVDSSPLQQFLAKSPHLRHLTWNWGVNTSVEQDDEGNTTGVLPNAAPHSFVLEYISDTSGYGRGMDASMLDWLLGDRTDTASKLLVHLTDEFGPQRSTSEDPLKSIRLRRWVTHLKLGEICFYVEPLNALPVFRSLETLEIKGWSGPWRDGTTAGIAFSRPFSALKVLILGDADCPREEESKEYSHDKLTGSLCAFVDALTCPIARLSIANCPQWKAASMQKMADVCKDAGIQLEWTQCAWSHVYDFD